MKKSVPAVLTLAVAGLFSAAAHADGLSANVSLVTKYKYRGQDQSDATKDAVPALQGGLCCVCHATERAGTVPRSNSPSTTASEIRTARPMRVCSILRRHTQVRTVAGDSPSLLAA